MNHEELRLSKSQANGLIGGSTSPDLIVLAGFGEGKLSATDVARSERDALLKQAAAVKIVTDPKAQEDATQVLRDLKAFTRQIEDDRVTVGTPVLELTKKINGLAKELTATIEAEYTRVGKIIGAFEAEQRKRREDAEKKARDEEQRILKEALAKEEAEQEKLRLDREEAAKKAQALQDEIAAKGARARSANGKAKAEAEAEEARLNAEIDAANKQQEADAAEQARIEEARLKMLTVRVEAVNAAPAKPTGSATRGEPCYEITNIVALYEAAPFLVVMKENVAALKAAIRGLQPGQQLPGVKSWMEHKTHVR